MFAGLTLFFALAFVHAIVRDFLKTFLDPPSHMRRKKGWSLFRRPAAQVPLVALEGSNDYRMLLARGSQMVLSIRFAEHNER